MKFYVIRHGETEFNYSDRLTGQTDIPISEEGVRQIKAVAQDIPKDIVAIYSSDLLRTKQTVEILNRNFNLPVLYDSRLRERSFGSLEGKAWTDFDVDGSIRAKDVSQKYDYRPYGGESIEDVRKRVLDCLKDIFAKEDGSPVLIVGHGGVIRLLHHLHNNEVHELVHNGSIHEFNIEF